MADVMKIALAIVLSFAGAFAIIRFFRKCGGVDEQVIGLILADGWIMGVLLFFFSKV